LPSLTARKLMEIIMMIVFVEIRNNTFTLLLVFSPGIHRHYILRKNGKHGIDKY
jgi:hypothetical protein